MNSGFRATAARNIPTAVRPRLMVPRSQGLE